MTPVPGESRSQEWLDESLAALDRVYFDDHLVEAGVTIRWRRWRPSKHYTYGWCHYDRLPPLIELHQSLAWLCVPSLVVLSVVYHEALHVVVGPNHDLAFNLAEKRFVHHSEVAAWVAEHEDWLHTAPKP